MEAALSMPITPELPPAPAEPTAIEAARATAALRILASGSTGNCSVLSWRDPAGARRVLLIDCGLSPRRTAQLLASFGLEIADISAIVLTHLDHDHVHAGWGAALPAHAPLLIHRRFVGRGERNGLFHHRTYLLDDPAWNDGSLLPGLRIAALLADHDQLGSAALRFDFVGPASAAAQAPRASLGFATDLGCVTDRLITHLAGVGVLAIESNYCPQLQSAAPRPAFLKRRIMGGKGHLSNQQSAAAVRAINPEHAVVLLHLSRQCNRPELAQSHHADHPVPVVLSAHDRPTGWIAIPPARRPPEVVFRPPVQPGLFSALSC